jgi:hypothetical protein
MDASISEEITNLRKSAMEASDRAEKLERLATLYPDLKKQVGRWEKVARKSAMEASDRAEKLERLATLYPDLKKQVGRWEKVAYNSSPSANEHVDKFDLRHNCGCCDDSPLELWPYLETEFGKVYSSPVPFVVGEKEYSHGDRPYGNWKQLLNEAKIPDSIIEQIQSYFDKQEQERQESSEDDEDND